MPVVRRPSWFALAEMQLCMQCIGAWSVGRVKHCDVETSAGCPGSKYLGDTLHLRAWAFPTRYRPLGLARIPSSTVQQRQVDTRQITAHCVISAQLIVVH